jgi:hypothetical protein
MASKAMQDDSWRGTWVRKLLWGGATFLFLLPAIAMPMTEEVNWTAGDFAFAAVLLFGSAGIVELAMRASSSLAFRAGALFAIGASFLNIWVNAAVGMVGSEGNAYNLLFLGVIVIGLAGAAAARFRARGLAIAMAVAGAAQILIGAGGISSDQLGGTIAAAFGGLWLISAILFHMAARVPTPA